MPNALSQKELLKLITDEELEAFLRELRVTGHLTRQQLEDQLSQYSRSTILSALVSIKSSAIQMLGDIVEFLEANGFKLRTTGFTLALSTGDKPLKCAFNPQTVGLAADFHKLRRNKQTLLDWDSIAQKWRQEIRLWIHRAIQAGKPTVHPSIDRRKLALGTYFDGNLYRKEVGINSDDLNLLLQLWRTLKFLTSKTQATLKNASEIQIKLFSELKDAEILLERTVKESQDTIRTAQREGDDLSWSHEPVTDFEPWQERWPTDKLFSSKSFQSHSNAWERWIAFVENVLLLAEHRIDENLMELLRLDLLKDRPRLFEVWLLTQIVKIYHRSGCTISMDSIKEVEGKPVWWLNYARGSKPVCQIEKANEVWNLYYQLYQEGPDRANMPDIALTVAEEKIQNVIWIADPKYSEKGGYSLRDYTEVAERYESVFNAEAVWICEYFPRKDIVTNNWQAVTNHSLIITDVSPEGRGLGEIKKRIYALHGWGRPLMLAIDMSGSFAKLLHSMETDVKKLMADADIIIPFAATTQIRQRTQLPENAWSYIQRLELGTGTEFRPLASALINVAESAIIKPTLIILSDRGFNDFSQELWSQIEHRYAEITWISNAQDLGSLYPRQFLDLDAIKNAAEKERDGEATRSCIAR